MSSKSLYARLIEGKYGSDQGVSPIVQLSKFGLVGVLNTIIGYFSFLIFLSHSDYLLSLFMSHILGIINSYLWNKYWTFKSNNKFAKEFLKFYSIYAILFLANAVFLAFFVDILMLDPKLGQLIILPIITLSSFLGHKYWSFNC